MNLINGNSVVSCYVDAVSLLMMFLVLTFSERMRHRETRLLRIFHLLLLCITANCIFTFVYNAMYMQTASWCHITAMIFKTLQECMNLVILYLWLTFLDYKLYGNQRWKDPVFRFVLLLLLVLLLLFIVNIFTGTVFTFSESNILEPKRLLYYICFVEFGIFVLSAIIARVYDGKSMKIRFLHLTPMLLSVVFASGSTIYSPYDIEILGFVIGIILLCFSLLNEYRFKDEKSGLYNSDYLVYLFNLALKGKRDIRSALIMEPGGNLPVGFEILRDTLYKNYDIVRIEEKKFIMFSGIDSRSELQLLSSQLEEAVQEYNTEHPDETVLMEVSSRMRTGDEDSVSFLRSTLQEKDAGDPVRGVVSMISELDRLDQELKLAADIQINMLPRNFPPFPDRTEFELYASMTPAKEIGGDFYDFFLIDNDHLGLVIADVSGKGIPAALFMMVAKTLIKNQLMSGCNPAEALEHVSQQLYERNSSMMFVTVWLAVLQISTGRGTACNAGHEDPAVRRAGGDFELLKYKHGMVIGISKKSKYQNREFELHHGDCLLVYTDGVPEATNAALDMFGTERLTDTLNQDANGKPEELIHRVRAAVDRFADGTPQFDDITMLCLKYYGTIDDVSVLQEHQDVLKALRRVKDDEQ